MKIKPLHRQSLAVAAFALSFGAMARAGNIVRFETIDPYTGVATAAYLHVESEDGYVLNSETPAISNSVDLDSFQSAPDIAAVRSIPIKVGQTLLITQVRPIKTITIRVTASRLRANASPIPTAGVSRTRSEIVKFTNTAQADTKQLTKGQPGVTEDSAGQQHVRGEHTDITYVVDGVMVPDTLSGRQGSIVVPSTIQNLDIITGGFAPEFGGQAAAVLNISTLPGVKSASVDATIQSGTFNSQNGDLTAVGPIGKNASFVLDLNSNRTDALIEPPQPQDQTAHNLGTSEGIFGKLRFAPTKADSFILTLSGAPDAYQVANRTGLPGSFASVGQGFGFGGLRNADGTRPDSTITNPGGLGSGPMVLASQQAAGQDIATREISEFGILNYVHKFNETDSAQLAFTVLHNGQELTNNNPAIDILNLPVDSSIEYSPTAIRNIHHAQGQGALSVKRGSHRLKAGFLYDAYQGNESYLIVPGSRLALDALLVFAPQLAPEGTSDPNQMDVNGNPIFVPTSGNAPVVQLKRQGIYRAFFGQDTYTSGRFTANFGLRFDHYSQSNSLIADSVDRSCLQPRLNFNYKVDSLTEFRWSYDKIMNTPPLAQGAQVGSAIQPEIVDQFDLGITHNVAKFQSITLAYYAKQIKNEVDVGLLIPGSQIGLYSAVNFDNGGVHGIEASYDFSSGKTQGIDGYLNYTYSVAAPSGFDNTGAQAPQFNDHDQRQTLGAGVAYTFKGGSTLASTFTYGSGLASSIVPPSADRTPRSEVNLKFSTGDKSIAGHGQLSIDIENLFDSQQVINFQSAFSGTRFQQARRILVSANFKF